MVLGEKPHISVDSYNTYDDTLVDTLVEHISDLSSVYHKTPEELAASYKKAVPPAPPKQEAEE